MSILTREAILSADDLKRESVSVPEWGGDVVVQEMTAKARTAWSSAVYSKGDDGEVKADSDIFSSALLVACCVGEDGEPLFTASDIAALSKKSGKAVERVLTVALRLNGMSEAAREEAKKN